MGSERDHQPCRELDPRGERGRSCGSSRALQDEESRPCKSNAGRGNHYAPSGGGRVGPPWRWLPLPLTCFFFLSSVYRKTLQINEARIVSRFGWGLAKAIENHGLVKFKTNLQRVSPTFITTFTNHLISPAVSRGAFSYSEYTSTDPVTTYGRKWCLVLTHGREFHDPRDPPFCFVVNLCA